MPDFFITKMEKGGCSYIIITVLISAPLFLALYWIKALMSARPMSWVPLTSFLTASAEPRPASIFTSRPSAL